MKQQRPSTMKEKIPKWKYSSQVHEHLLPLTMFHRILVFKFQSLLKKFKIPCCNVHSLLANFLTRTPVNYERKFQMDFIFNKNTCEVWKKISNRLRFTSVKSEGFFGFHLLANFMKNLKLHNATKQEKGRNASHTTLKLTF